MSPAQKLRLFVTERLNEVLVEILDVIDKSIAKYEQEATLSREVIARQHALLCSLNKPLMGQPSSGESEPDRLQRPSVESFTMLVLVTAVYLLTGGGDHEAPPTNIDPTLRC